MSELQDLINSMQDNPPEPILEDFSSWLYYVDICHFWKDGKEYVEYQHIKTKGTRATIDGEEVTAFTRKSQCCSSSTYAETINAEEHIFCDTCKQECLTYLEGI